VCLGEPVELASSAVKSASFEVAGFGPSDGGFTV
jgi:hypothetical protein